VPKKREPDYNEKADDQPVLRYGNKGDELRDAVDELISQKSN
jgi:hypothetical protein